MAFIINSLPRGLFESTIKSAKIVLFKILNVGPNNVEYRLWLVQFQKKKFMVKDLVDITVVERSRAGEWLMEQVVCNS